ncbi:MAG TPA: hypothetical protein VE871_03945 [Longimicrobium sp.]|nr:hypothetical protein [Longimicrobium sp.]
MLALIGAWMVSLIAVAAGGYWIGARQAQKREPSSGTRTPAVQRQRLEVLPQEQWDKDKAEFIWEEWSYRHSFYWKTFNQWVLVVLAVTSVPFLRKDMAATLGNGSSIFPVAGFIVMLIGALHLGIEHDRKDSINALLHAYRPVRWKVERIGLSRLAGIRAGRVSLLGYFVVLTVLTVSAFAYSSAWAKYAREEIKRERTSAATQKPGLSQANSAVRPASPAQEAARKVPKKR